MKTNSDCLNRASPSAWATGNISRPVLLFLAVLTAGLAQPASAAVVESSWSYVDDYRFWGGQFLSDDHRNDPTTQGSSAVALNATNYARSSAGPGSDGTLNGRLAVSAYSAYQAHTQSSYRENWGACSAGTCGTTLPTYASLNIELSQDGTFSLLGGTSISLSYGLTTETEAYSFMFEVWQEGDTVVQAWLARENLITGQMYLPVDVPVTVWQEAGEDFYHFSYHTTFSSDTLGAFREELSLGASVYGGGEHQFVDSENSFHAALSSDSGVEFASDGSRHFGTSEPQSSVPEPATSLLLAIGLLGLGAMKKAHRRVSPS